MGGEHVGVDSPEGKHSSMVKHMVVQQFSSVSSYLITPVVRSRNSPVTIGN